jgi:hypothetical protein
MKSLLTIAILLGGTLTLDSCQDKFGGTADTNIAVVVKDKLGNNLLDQTSVGHYDASQIRLFSVNNGVRTEIANSKFKITSEHGGSLNFGAEAASPNSGNQSVTAVVWGQNNEDVIESTVEHSKNSTQCSHVKCNGVTKYNKDSGTARVIEIIK